MLSFCPAATYITMQDRLDTEKQLFMSGNMQASVTQALHVKHSSSCLQGFLGRSSCLNSTFMLSYCPTATHAAIQDPLDVEKEELDAERKKLEKEGKRLKGPPAVPSADPAWDDWRTDKGTLAARYQALAAQRATDVIFLLLCFCLTESDPTINLQQSLCVCLSMFGMFDMFGSVFSETKAETG